MHLRRYLSLCLLASAAVSGQAAAAWTIDSSHTSAGFAVRHMMITKVRGEFTKVAGTVEYDPKNIAATKVDVAIEANSVDTRNTARDEHLRGTDFFDTAKFPQITFKSTKVAKAGKNGLLITGNFTMHGVTKELTLKVEELSPVAQDPWGNQRIGAHATALINRKDYGLVWNKALDSGGVLVGDEVEIQIDVEVMQPPSPKAT